MPFDSSSVIFPTVIKKSTSQLLIHLFDQPSSTAQLFAIHTFKIKNLPTCGGPAYSSTSRQKSLQQENKCNWTIKGQRHEDSSERRNIERLTILHKAIEGMSALPVQTVLHLTHYTNKRCHQNRQERRTLSQQGRLGLQIFIFTQDHSDSTLLKEAIKGYLEGTRVFASCIRLFKFTMFAATLYCWNTVNFGTLKDWSLLIRSLLINIFASNNRFSDETFKWHRRFVKNRWRLFNQKQKISSCSYYPIAFKFCMRVE